MVEVNDDYYISTSLAVCTIVRCLGTFITAPYGLHLDLATFQGTGNVCCENVVSFVGALALLLY